MRDATTSSAWNLYWDGAYLDRFESSRHARAAALALCSRRRCELIELQVEDASGCRYSTERLLHEPEH